MAIKRTSLAGTPETSITYYSVGGHNHDGISSTLIDSSKYSIFDFNPSLVGNDRNRRALQDSNFNSFKTFIINTVNESVLSPAGVVLAPNSIGATNIISNSITANELAANIVLINNKIQSSNYSNTPGFESGWLIANTGNAEFNNITVRGNIVGGSSININSNSFIVQSNGSVTATTGRIGPVAITKTGMTSKGSSPQLNANTNFFAFGDFGDLAIYSNPGSDIGGAHVNQFHKSLIVGEYITVQKGTDSSFSNITTDATMGDIDGLGYSEFRLKQNNIIRIKLLNEGLYINSSTGTLRATVNNEGLYLHSSTGTLRTTVSNEGIYLNNSTGIQRASLLNEGLYLNNSSGAQLTSYELTYAYITGYVYATGNISAGGNIYGTNKYFLIQHPLYENKYLQHAAIEGPTSDVFYRGKGIIKEGRATIELPNYFSSLVKLDTVTVSITTIYNKNNHEQAVLYVENVNSNSFTVVADNPNNFIEQEFYWRVEAERKDSSFNVEPLKSDFDSKKGNNGV